MSPVFNPKNKYLPLAKLAELAGVPASEITVEQYRLAGVLPFYIKNYKAPDSSKDQRVLAEIQKAHAGKKHKVYAYSADNEILEFHGDSLLRLIIAEYLLGKFPGKDEAFYSRVRINCEKKTSLALFARERGIAGEYALVSKDHEKLRHSIHTVEDIFEAFVSGLYHAFGPDSDGYSVATYFVRETLDKTSMDIVEDTNYKNRIIAAGSISKGTTATYTMPTEIALCMSNGKSRHGAVVYDRRYGKCIGASTGTSVKKATEAATRQGLAYLTDGTESDSVPEYLSSRAKTIGF